MSTPTPPPPRTQLMDYPYRLRSFELAAQVADEGDDYYDLDELIKAADKIYLYLTKGELPRVQDDYVNIS